MSTPVVDLTRLSGKERSAAWSFSGRPASLNHSESVPGPGSYRLPSMADEISKRRSGLHSRGFGVGERLKPRPATAMPAPGSYDPSDPRKHGSLSITMKSRTELRNTAEETPGPGAYNAKDVASIGGTSIKLKGRWSEKKLKDSAAIPGPGAYSPQMIEGSVYIGFGHGERMAHQSKHEGPDPGAYTLPSTLDMNHAPVFKGRWKERRVSSSGGDIGVISTQFATRRK